MTNYEPRRLAGRCRNGAERDAGKLWHAAPRDSEYTPALCGATPGYTSVGWSSHQPENATVTCKRCLKKLKRLVLEQPADGLIDQGAS